MQATDFHAHGLTTAGAPDREQLLVRLPELEEELGSEGSARVRAILEDRARTAESVRDAVSTQLMEAFRCAAATGLAGPRGGGGMNRACFGLLYELNCHHLLVQVAARLRRYQSKADARDVLQEVFFNVYRYPHRFDSEREDAFRVWSATIVRNTVLKHIRSQKGAGRRTEVPFEDLSDQPETRAVSPLGGVIESESRANCVRAYLTYLQLYLRFYQMLSERERRALHLVEIDELGYRDAAAELGIKLENLKMVVFRARKKIHRSMRRVFEGLPPDCRPARDPRGSGGIEADGNELSGRGTGGVDSPARRRQERSRKDARQ